MKNKVFTISFERLAVLLLPICLRTRLLVALVTCFASIFSKVLRTLGTFRNDKLEDIEVTGQVCKLEALLNNKFDATQRRIRIVDADTIGTLPTLIYPRGTYEEKPLPRGQKATTPQMILNPRTTNAQIFSDFYVLVPEGLLADTELSRLSTLVATYKLQSKAYNITIID